MKSIFKFSVVIFCLLSSLGFAQKNSWKKGNAAPTPKLVVAIVVDQMRYDFLYKYSEKYGDSGIKRLLNEGYNCRNTHYNYCPTYTGPGHASIFTGTTPSVHGIIGNEWFDRTEEVNYYCVGDASQKMVGTGKDNGGKLSPDNLLVGTIGDELQLYSNHKSKVIGVSLKDRGAILPAGHAATAAYWYDGNTNGFVSSSYYMSNLPNYVTNFNNKKPADKYIAQGWTPLLGDVNLYTESTPDNTDFENPFPGEKYPIFPHKLSEIIKSEPDVLRKTPFANTILKDFAKEIITNEAMGKHEFSDFLSISFSATDYVGHQFGPQSVEAEDTYLRLDKDLQDLISFLNNKVGRQNYVLFLTADHGVSPVIKQMDSLRIPSWNFDDSEMPKRVNDYLIKALGEGGQYVSAYSNNQVFLNQGLIERKGMKLDVVAKTTTKFFMGLRGVYNAYTIEEINRATADDKILFPLKNGIHPKRSGDVVVVLRPGWTDAGRKGTTHGSQFTYDTHVPLLFYGWNVEKGSSDMPYNIIDIAPTISEFLKIEAPNGCTGSLIPGVVK
ncbi:MAG: alkaline phosphatase family protein [Bacteroidetes bacterium]|nr:alkaline phosphatase family protein [Bacteroidota bacterium]